MNTKLNRRRFLGVTAAAVAGSVLPTVRGKDASPGESIRAVAFDAFPILDPRPVFALVEELFPGKGESLSNAWRTRQFEYTWLRTTASQYKDFWQVTEDALMFAAKSLKIDLNDRQREELMNTYLRLKAWPDVPDALKSLETAGIQVAFLSNFTGRMLEAGLKNSGLEDRFDQVLSTDRVKKFKPAPEAYNMALEAFGFKRESIAFAAFAGWDAAGAKWFGYPTVWVNRLHAPLEQLSATPDIICNDLAGLVAFATRNR